MNRPEIMFGGVFLLLVVGVSSVMMAHAQNATSAGADKFKAAISQGKALAGTLPSGSKILIAVCPPTASTINDCDVFNAVKP